MPDYDDYNREFHRRNPVGNWWDTPPVGGPLPLPPPLEREPRQPMPGMDPGYSPPWATPISHVPGVIDPIAPMYPPR